MKKFLVNFEDEFEPHILARGKKYYKENRIIDIWCQDNSITAYVDGTEIYKIELEISNKEILNHYCTCPYCEGGEFLCKHIAAVLYYLRENDVPELEILNNRYQQQARNQSNLSSIYSKINNKLRKIRDRDGYIDYYNGRYFVNLISDITDNIAEFIHTENYNDAFELIKYAYQLIKNANMDGSNGEYQESFYLVSEGASKLLYDEEYYDIFEKYTREVILNNTLDEFSDSPLYAFLLYVHDKESAKRVIKILDNIELDYSFFVDPIADKISLTYHYINADDAIQLCYENIEHYGVKELLIQYLKNNHRIDEVVRILKDDIKNHVRKDIAYERLLNIYDENHMYQEKKKLLPEVIIETSNFRRYKELKKMCDELEWQTLKEKIIANANPRNNCFLEDVYMEENEVSKLFDLLKQNPSMYKIARYQKCLKDKYSKELLCFYKSQILEQSKIVSERTHYQELCIYIKRMGELNNSEDFIFEMLKEMYPSYKSKRAFKEEILNVLSDKNKARFYEFIQK